MGNNQALQVSAEALSGMVGGFTAALFVELPLILLRLLAMTAALFLALEAGRQPTNHHAANPILE